MLNNRDNVKNVFLTAGLTVKKMFKRDVPLFLHLPRRNICYQCGRPDEEDLVNFSLRVRSNLDFFVISTNAIKILIIMENLTIKNIIMEHHRHHHSNALGNLKKQPNMSLFEVE